MNELGRNIRFFTWMINRGFLARLATLVVMVLLFGVLSEDKTFLSAIIIFSVAFSTLIDAMSLGEIYFNTAVSCGSARKSANMAMVMAQHINATEQGVLLFVLAIVLDSDQWMMAVRACPFGIVAALLLILGMGLLISALSIRGNKAMGLIIALVFIIVSIGAVMVWAVLSDLSVNMEWVKMLNNPLLLCIGLAVDMLGSVVYCKVGKNVDLKLA